MAGLRCNKLLFFKELHSVFFLEISGVLSSWK